MSDGYQFHQSFPDSEAKYPEEETLMGGILISTRMGIFIFVSLIAIALLVVGLYLARREMLVAADSMAVAGKTTSTVASLETKAWRIRNDEKDYLLNNDPQYAATHKADVEEFTGILNGLNTQPDSEALKKHIATINDAVTQQVRQFSRIVKIDGGQTAAKINATETRFVDSGRKLIDALAKSRVVEIKNIIAAIKKHQTAFIGAGGENSLARLQKLSAELLAIIENAPSKDKAMSRVQTMVKVYQTNLNAYAMQRLNREKMIVRLGEIFSYMTANLDNLAAAADNGFKNSSRKVRELSNLLQILLPAGGTAILLVVILFGHIVMRSIATPVMAVAVATRKLAAGEADVTIPALGNKDEIGDIAFALTDIKANLASATQMKDDIAKIKVDADRNMIPAEETSRMRKEMEAALEEAERLRKDMEKAKLQIEKGETAAIEAALLRIDLETTKAELEKAMAAAVPDVVNQEPERVLSKQRSGPISTIGRQLAVSSKIASAAAYEAERTGTLIRGLSDAAEKIGEVEAMLAKIGEQTDVIVYPSDVKEPPRGDANSNLVVLTSEYRNAVDQASGKNSETNEIIGQRFDAIRNTANKITWAIRGISETINDVKKMAFDIASASSEEAIKVTSELLEQSEHLRGMLGSLIDNMRGGGADQPDGSADEAEKKDHPTSYMS